MGYGGKLTKLRTVPKNIEIVDSCFLYVGKPGDLNALLDQITELFKDLDIQDIREWFKREIKMAGYVLKVPILKGHEHLYLPLMERFALPKNPTTTNSQYFPIEDDDVEPRATTEPEITPTRVISFEEPVNVINTQIPLRQKDADNIRETILHYPQVGHYEEETMTKPLEIAIYPQDDNKVEKEIPTQHFVNIHENSVEPLYIEKPNKVDVLETAPTLTFRKEKPVFYMGENSEQDTEPAVSMDLKQRPLYGETLIPIGETLSKVEPLEEIVEEPAQSEITMPLQQNMPEWIYNEKANREPKYSVVDMYNNFPKLARLMGYMDNRNCKLTQPTLVDLDIDPMRFVQSWKSLNDF